MSNVDPPPEYIITIPDFAAGIISDDHGALVPLPARQPHVLEPVLPRGLDHTADYIPGLEESYQLDIKVISPAYSPAYINRETALIDHESAMVAVMHSWYLDPYAGSGWAAATELSDYATLTPNWQTDILGPPGTFLKAPLNFPDATAFFIWDSSGTLSNAPQKTLHFRKTFTLAAPTTVKVYASGDNLLSLIHI